MVRLSLAELKKANRDPVPVDLIYAGPVNKAPKESRKKPGTTVILRQLHERRALITQRFHESMAQRFLLKGPKLVEYHVSNRPLWIDEAIASAHVRNVSLERSVASAGPSEVVLIWLVLLLGKTCLQSRMTERKEWSMVTPLWVSVITAVIGISTVLMALYVTRINVAAQRDLKRTEIKAELFAKTKQLWIADFRHLTSNLLTLCDPDCRPTAIHERAAHVKEITGAVHLLSLHLDPYDEDHNKFGLAMFRLAMAAQPKYASDNSADAGFKETAVVIDLAKVVLNKELKWVETRFSEE